MALDVPLDAKNFFQLTVGKKSGTSRDLGFRASDIGQTFQDSLVMTASICLRIMMPFTEFDAVCTAPNPSVFLLYHIARALSRLTRGFFCLFHYIRSIALITRRSDSRRGSRASPPAKKLATDRPCERTGWMY